MGNSLTTIRHITNVAGLSCFLISLYPKLIIKNPKVLRPLLNISWGYLFGTTFWLGFFSEIGVIRGIREIRKKPFPQNAEEAKVALEKFIEYKKNSEKKLLDYQFYFSSATLSSGILLLSTVRLASQNSQLRICSSVVSVCCLLNSAFLFNALCKSGEKKEKLYRQLAEYSQEETLLDDIKKNRKDFHVYHILSILCFYTSFLGLTPYIFT